MATALSIALKAAIEDNWVAGSGGTEPTVYGSDFPTWPSIDEWIRILGWTFDMGGFRRRNETYIGYWEEITFEVSTKNHADLESRLDEMTNELRRILTPTNLTGYHTVDIVRRTRIKSDQTAKKWAEQMTVRATILSTASAATPGSTTRADGTFDTLTVTTTFTNNGVFAGSAFLDDDSMATATATKASSSESIKAYADTKMVDLVDDTTPQLGGDLDLNGKNIDFPTTSDISDCLDEDNMASDSATKLATQQSIKAYVDGPMLIGEANREWVACIYEGADDGTVEVTTAGYVRNIGAVDTDLFFMLPLPISRGGKSLKIDALSVELRLADANDFVDVVDILELGSTGWSNSLYNKDVNYNAAFSENQETFVAITPVDKRVVVKLDCTFTDAAAFACSTVALRCYYA